jgi:hypothetical protein
LLLGLRRHRDWASLRPRAFAASVATLRRSARIVVADVDADVEGERACGSIEVEERNLVARTVLAEADSVVVVTRPGPTGVYRLVRTIDALLEHGVPAPRVLPVVNRAPRSLRARAEITQAVARLAAPDAGVAGLPNPVFVPERRGLERTMHDASVLPDALCRPLASSIGAHLARMGDRPGRVTGPEPVVAGSLGHWPDEDDEAEP